MQTPAKNLYAILGVAPDASPEQLHTAYQTALRLNRDAPDGAEKNARLELIADAYTLLANPVRRQIYDASLATGESRLIDRKLQPEQHQPASRRSSGINPNGDDSLLAHVDADRINLWRKAIVLAAAICLPLLYFYRQAQVMQMQGQIMRSLESPEQQAYVAGKNRAADFRAFNDAKIRLVEIEEKLQELGPVSPERSAADNQEIQNLNDEKKHLQGVVKAVAEKYGRP